VIAQGLSRTCSTQDFIRKLRESGGFGDLKASWGKRYVMSYDPKGHADFEIVRKFENMIIMVI
jgi:hypothetical protein